ncbi:neutral/alkaline non-lysosomal ceramidase N-terminal domain-containing protein [Thermopirellula anaerolimosa]
MTRIRFLAWLIALGTAGGILTPGASAQTPAWKVGVARAVITPDETLWQAGYAARQRPAEGKMHDLWLKALALEAADGQRAVLITADVLGFPHASADRICGELEKKYGLRRDQIMLTASHTHSGPVLEGALYDIYPLDDTLKAAISRYTRRLESIATETVGGALRALQPGSLAAFEGSTDFAVNRRNNSEAEVPALRASGKPLHGPVNHRVPGMIVRDSQGKAIAAVFGYACHATVLDGYEWSGDYPGFAQLELEAANPGLTAMFFAGCGADQNPIPRRSVELCQSYGKRLAAAVMEAMSGPTRTLDPVLKTAFSTLELKYELPDEASLRQTAEGTGYTARWAQRLLAERDAGVSWPDAYPYPIQVWRLGADQIWVALGGEVVVDYANRLEQEISPHIWVAGYTNDVMAYIPSRRVREEGGYEAGAFPVYGLPAVRWQSDIEDRIVAEVRRLVDAVR